MLSGPQTSAALCAVLTVITATMILLYLGIVLLRDAEFDNRLSERRASSLLAALESRVTSLLRNSKLSLFAVAEFMGANFDGPDASLSSNSSFARFLGQLRDSDPDAPFSVISFSPLVPLNQIGEFESRIRQVNSPHFDWYSVDASVSDQAADNVSAAFPILYRYPMPLPPANYSFGRDLLAEPVRRSAVLTAVRTGMVVASEPLILFNTLQVATNLHLACRRYDANDTVVGVAVAIFPFAAFAETALAGIETDVAGFEWFDTVSNRSLYMWRPPTSAAPSGNVSPLSPNSTSLAASKSIGTVYQLHFKFAQRSWRLDVCFYDEGANVDHQVVVPVVFVAVAIGVAVAVAMVLCIRSASARENGQRQLLSMVFPVHIASALISRLCVRDGRVTVETGGSIAKYHEFVTLIFIDICDFTTISSFLEPHMLVRFVDEFVCVVDKLLARYPRLLKIKTIGDAYFVAAGLSGDDHEQVVDGLPYHALCLRDALDFCARVQHEVQSRHCFHVRPKSDSLANLSRTSSASPSLSRGTREEVRSLKAFDDAYDPKTGRMAVRVRVGVHIGAVVAGVCGRERPVYDVWGDTCNVAARIESSAANGTIQLSSQVQEILSEFNLTERFRLRKRRRERVLKGIGAMATYTLVRDMESSIDSEDESGDTDAIEAIVK